MCLAELPSAITRGGITWAPSMYLYGRYDPVAATFLKNRSDMKWGAIVLMLAFAFVVAQSLILVNAA